jgi:glycosidase
MTTHPWAADSIFYHIYPLGLTGAPQHNDFSANHVPRLEQLYPWLDHIQSLGANALYLGPLFESSAHGYDTVDYFRLDRRLGTQQTLADFSQEVHRRGMRLILDGVFNHVGRDFWAFKDLQTNRQQSAFTGWFHNLDFSRSSPYNDPFSYEGWSGHYDLVKLNLFNQDVRSHLFHAITTWVDEFEIDGLRLDAADQLAPEFLSALSNHCRGLRSDFWLMGEIVFGDYRKLANDNMLDSTTNYECYKGLFSSHVDHNYFEIAYSLNRLFGPHGTCRHLDLYNFVDNHDVNRVASNLKDQAHLYPLYSLLFTMPGIPSIYYGSEWGITGQRSNTSDNALRPQLDLAQAAAYSPNRDLAQAIRHLSSIRSGSPALRHGEYQQLSVANEQFAFLRSTADEQIVVIVNSAKTPARLNLRLPLANGQLVDLLNPGATFRVSNGAAQLDPIPACWACILKFIPD